MLPKSCLYKLGSGQLILQTGHFKQCTYVQRVIKDSILRIDHTTMTIKLSSNAQVQQVLLSGSFGNKRNHIEHNYKRYTTVTW